MIYIKVAKSDVGQSVGDNDTTQKQKNYGKLQKQRARRQTSLSISFIYNQHTIFFPIPLSSPTSVCIYIYIIYA